MRLPSRPLLTWTAKLRSFAGTWSMWILIIAAGSVLAGMAVGQMPVPDDDTSHTVKPNIGSNSGSLPGAETPGGAPGADISLERAHKDAFARTAMDSGYVQDCPLAANIVSDLVVTMDVDRSLLIASSMHLTATGVTPPNPPSDLNQWLQRPDGARVFAGCFIATDADINSIVWADGKLDANIDLKWNDNPHAPIGYTNKVIETNLYKSNALLTVDMCAPHPEWASGLRLSCIIGAQSTVVVRVPQPLRNSISAPVPASQQFKDGYFETTWHFDGPMPRLNVVLDAPPGVLASSWLYWNRGHVVQMPALGSASIDWYYIFDSSAIWLALLTAAVLLRGKRSAARHSSARRLILVVVAGLLLGVEIRGLGRLNEAYSNGLIVILCWALLAVAASGRRRAVAVLAISAVALIPFGWLALADELGTAMVQGLQVWFSIALLSLVTVAAWALWTQIRTVTALAGLDQDGSTWRQVYARLVDAIMVAAFMFGIGFPFGEILASGDSPFVLARLSSDLVWSTGLLFRAPLAWISLLLAISYLAGYLVERSTAARSPAWRRDGRKARWIRVANRAVAAILALLLSLSAPWTARFAIGFLPVWILQFGVLWLAFSHLNASAPARRPARPHKPRRVRLLSAAIGTPPVEAMASAAPAAPRDGAPAVAAPHDAPAAVAAAVKPNSRATGRLLALGPQPGQLANAKSAAQVAAVIAIVPVVYILWTALKQFGDQLNTSTEYLTVALLALVELVRWLVSGFLFGYLYRKLPGRIGPIKALSFAAIWVCSCLGPLVIAQISDSGVNQQVIYRSAQTALFSIILAVIIDLQTIRSANGTWRDLRKVYDLQNYGEVVAALAPAVLLVLTLAQQINAGSGEEVADTLLNGITSVLKGPL